MLRTSLLLATVMVASLGVVSAPVGATTPGTATISVKPSKGLVQGTTVHVSGGGFAPNGSVVVAECKAGHPVGIWCDESNARFQNADSAGRYSLDFTVNSTLIATGFGFINCTTRAGACTISVTNEPSFDNSATAPISFAMTDVISRFSSDELTAIEHVGAALGVTADAVPRVGAFALAWVLALTSTGPITPAPDKGPVRLVTHWLPSDYLALSAAAAQHDTSTAEFQKTGALFVAYELAIS